MPDGRFVAKAISTDDILGGVSFDADYLFGRCIPHLDREGRMSGNPRTVKATVAPLRDELTVDRVALALCELAESKVVQWYEIEEKRVLQFPNFKKHQRGAHFDREAESLYPGPHTTNAAPVKTSTLKETLARINSGSTPDLVRVSEVKSSEVKLREVKKNAAPITTRADWLTSAAAAWKERCGGEPSFGRLGKVLRPLVVANGEDVVLARWKFYLKESDPQYATPNRFAETFGHWDPKNGKIDLSPFAGPSFDG